MRVCVCALVCADAVRHRANRTEGCARANTKQTILYMFDNGFINPHSNKSTLPSRRLLSSLLPCPTARRGATLAHSRRPAASLWPRTTRALPRPMPGSPRRGPPFSLVATAPDTLAPPLSLRAKTRARLHRRLSPSAPRVTAACAHQRRRMPVLMPLSPLRTSPTGPSPTPRAPAQR